MADGMRAGAEKNIIMYLIILKRHKTHIMHTEVIFIVNTVAKTTVIIHATVQVL